MKAVKAQHPIRRADLVRSIQACHRVEDAMWGELQAAGCTEQSGPGRIEAAIVDIRQLCPGALCEPDVWGRYADIYVTWAKAHGSLQVFWRLRRMRGK